MDLAKYQELTGITVASADAVRIAAMCDRARINLESLLGYTLDPESIFENQYEERGKTTVELPFLSQTISLNPADPVAFAYRLFSYNNKDKYLRIDPCTSVNSVKLVKDGVTYKTFTTDEYRVDYKYGFSRDIQLIIPVLMGQNYLYYATTLTPYGNNFQLAVDASWLWEDDEDIPQDLLSVWVDMIVYFSNPKKHLKAESIGPHTYTQYDTAFIRPESILENVKIIQKYVGGNGTKDQIPVI